MTQDNVVHGTSDDIIQFSEPIEVAFVVEVAYDGAEYFAVDALDSDGEEIASLVSRVGPYRGRVLYLDDDAVPMLKVEGQGAWRLAVMDVQSTRHWDGYFPVAGSSDDVLFIPGGADTFRPITFRNRGDSYVSVTSYSENDSDVLVSVVGDYEGTVGLKRGSLLIQIETEGQWQLVAR